MHKPPAPLQPVPCVQVRTMDEEANSEFFVATRSEGAVAVVTSEKEYGADGALTGLDADVHEHISLTVNT